MDLKTRPSYVEGNKGQDMNHHELRAALDRINDMDRKEASCIVTEVLKYIMDSIQPERSKREDLTTTSPLPPDLERRLVDEWKRDMLS